MAVIELQLFVILYLRHWCGIARSAGQHPMVITDRCEDLVMCCQ
jgi:hypothetical protein